MTQQCYCIRELKEAGQKLVALLAAYRCGIGVCDFSDVAVIHRQPEPVGYHNPGSHREISLARRI